MPALARFAATGFLPAVFFFAAFGDGLFFFFASFAADATRRLAVLFTFAGFFFVCFLLCVFFFFLRAMGAV